MTKKSNKLRPGVWITAVLLIVICVFCLFLLRPGKTGTEQGISYLQNQQNKDISALQQSIDARRSEERRQAVEEGKVSVFSLFDNSVLLGDSRALGFSEYGFLPENQVKAALGYTIEDAARFKDEIAAAKPSVIYLSYGVNDVSKNVGGAAGQNGYASVFEQQVDNLLEADPGAKIVVNSILPVSEIGKAETEGWERIAQYNADLQALCERRGWVFVSNDALVQQDPDAYERDGIHFQKYFYPLWAQNMLEASMQV